MTYPPDSEYVYNALANSLKYETGSYKQFRNYLLLGNKKRYHLNKSVIVGFPVWTNIFQIPFNALNIDDCRSNELY